MERGLGDHGEGAFEVRAHSLPFDFKLPDRRLREFAEEHGIVSLGLMPAFQDHHQRTGTYLHGFGSVITEHWNEAGRRGQDL